MPYAYRDRVLHRIVIVPGFIGEALLGVIAGLVFGGARAAIFDLPVQSSFDAAGFLRPISLSIPVGIVAAEYLSLRAAQVLADVENSILRAAEQTAEP